MKLQIAYGLAVLITVGAACGTRGNNGNSGNGGDSGQTASLTIDLAGGNFSDNSVLICGSRPPVDGKIRCASNLSQISGAAAVVPDAGDAGDGGAVAPCVCFNFAADGSLMDSMGNPVVINGLCPSSDLGADASVDAGPIDWTFMYSIFTSPNCMGTQLNDGKHNFTCFDSRDLNSMAFPNESVEPLNPGPNANHVICATTNGSKSFNFASCSSSCDTPAPDGGCAVSRFDCGCTPADAGNCNCGDGGVGPGDIPATCSFDATCNIVCGT